MSKVLVLDEYATIDKIKEGYSLSRYGDGEFFRLLSSSKGISKLQKFDGALRDKLLTIFSEPLGRLLIGVPRMDSPKQWVINFNKAFNTFIVDKKSYHESIFVSAFVSRPSIVGKQSAEYFKAIKSLWEDRSVVLINFNDMLPNHYLFKDCAVDFIKIPRRDCFDVYDSIVRECEKFYGHSKIFLASAGPAATCIAYDITSAGEQCLDIGQVAFEYSLFKGGRNLESWTSQNSYRRKK